jgi:hypothetical protein
MSYAWRSILKGIELLNEGSSSVWEMGKLSIVGRIHGFLESGTGCPSLEGEMQLLQLLLNSLIPSHVKSAYKLHRRLLQLHSKEPMGESSAPEEGFSWYNIWNSPCPPNIKTFLWRIAHNSLPVNWNIQRRGMDVDPVCPVCKRLNEDGGHLFFRCKEVKRLWNELELKDLDLRVKLLDCEDAKQVLSVLLHQNVKIKLKTIALMWTWWKTRNKTNAEGGVRNLGQVKAQILRLANEYEEAFVKKANKNTSQVSKWKHQKLRMGLYCKKC